VAQLHRQLALRQPHVRWLHADDLYPELAGEQSPKHGL
jgi:hypothetical protein